MLSACGSGGEGTAADVGTAQRIFPNSPVPQVPSGPPPKDIVIKDLVKGKGSTVPPITNTAQVKIAALYTAVEYETGEIFEERWDPQHPYEVEFDPSLNPGWEEALPGMKAGGRREVIMPASMTYPHEIPLAYVIDLLRVEKLGGSAAGSG